MNKKSKLDLSKYNCPMIFVKTKIFLEKHTNFKNKMIIVKGRKNLESLNNTLLDKNIKTIVTSLENEKFQIRLL
tara:strand:+ start:2914 stop:3135 length:222 start_codon:yes stop_codon:yes gene_type:complete